MPSKEDVHNALKAKTTVDPCSDPANLEKVWIGFNAVLGGILTSQEVSGITTNTNIPLLKQIPPDLNEEECKKYQDILEKTATTFNSECLRQNITLLSLFGKRRRRKLSPKKKDFIPKALKNKCKRLNIRLTTTRNGKRYPKSRKMLERQCK